jgi:PEP-CTERM motif
MVAMGAFLPRKSESQCGHHRRVSFLGDQGPVFFLAATFDSTPVTRFATVRSDQFLFFPLISVVSWEQISAHGGSEAGLRQDAAETIGIGPGGPSPGTTLFARLNGVDLALPPPTTSLFDFRQMSPPGLFDVTLPSDAIFGLPPGTFPSVSDGWWLMLGPLAPGNYELHYGGTSQGIGAYVDAAENVQDNTYRLTVLVPEPSTWVMLLAGFAGLGFAGYRRAMAGHTTRLPPS